MKYLHKLAGIPNRLRRLPGFFRVDPFSFALLLLLSLSLLELVDENSHEALPNHVRSPKIIRPGQYQPVVGRPRNPSLLLCLVHRFEGRTIPCDGEHCEFHKANIQTEERLFIAIQTRAIRRFCVLDLPASHYAAMEDAKLLYGGLDRGIFRFSRLYPKPNAPIVIKHRPATDGDRLPGNEVEMIPLMDEILESNRLHALHTLQSEKTGSRGLNLFDDR